MALTPVDCTSIKMKWNVDEWVSIFNFLSIAQTDPQIKKSNDSWWMRISSSSIHGNGCRRGPPFGIPYASFSHPLNTFVLALLVLHPKSNPVGCAKQLCFCIFASLLSPAAHYITRWYSATVSHSSLTHDFMNTFICTLHATSSVPAAGSRKKNPKKKERAVKKLLFHFGMWDEGV